MIKVYSTDIDATGAAGAATGNKDVQMHTPGRLLAVAIDYVSAPATTVVTVSTPGLPGVANVVAPAGNTDRVLYPRVAVQTAAGADIAGRAEEPPLVSGRVNIALSAANSGTGVVRVRLFIES